MKLLLGSAQIRAFALLMFFFLALAFIPDVRAQNIKPWNNKYESYSQMWSISNTYSGEGSRTYYSTATSNNLGSQLDTVAAGQTLLIAILGFNPNACTLCTDTFTYKTLYGNGYLTMSVSALATNTITTVAVTPQQSMNGIDWTPITSVTVASVTSTSKTTPVVGTSTTIFTVSVKYGLYYRLSCVGVTDAAQIKANYHYLSPVSYTITGP